MEQEWQENLTWIWSSIPEVIYIYLFIISALCYKIMLFYNFIGFSGNDVLAQGSEMFQPWLTKLDRFLQAHLGQSYKKTHMTKRSVQFEYRGIEVDLLVSPYYASQHDFYQFLKTIHPSERERWEVLVSSYIELFFFPWQVFCVCFQMASGFL